MIRLLLLAHLALPTAHAAKTPDAAQRTYWDQMMEGQAIRSLYRGSRFLDGGNYSRALREFSRAVIARPYDPDAHRMLGVAYYWTGDVGRAQTEFEESLRLSPNVAQTHLLMGIVYAWKGRVGQAYQAFVRAGKIDPDRPDIQMNIGSMEETRGDYIEALSRFRRAVELGGEHPLYHFQLGMLYRRLGRDVEALESMNKALKIFPTFQDAILEVGAIYERMGSFKNALTQFNRAVRLKRRDVVARLRLARLHLMREDEKQARDILRDTFRLTPRGKGGGLALSLSYGGTPKPSQNNGAASPKGSSGSSGAGQSKPQPPQGPLDLLRRNLERIPLTQDAVLEVDVAFLPKVREAKLVRRGVDEAPSALKKALGEAGKMPLGSTLGAKREFRMRGGSMARRRKDIEGIVKDLKGVLDSSPPQSETRFAMNLNFSDSKLGSRAQGGG